MNTLILGGNGFIGSNIAKGLKRLGHNIQVIDYPEIDLSMNLTEFIDWCKVNKLKECDTLINCVGVNGAQESFSLLRHFFQLNGFSAMNVAHLIKQLGCTTFIHISSETVLGAGENIDEKRQMAPAHPYAFSKGIFEAYMMTDPIFDSIKSIALRLPIITGEDNSIESALDFIKQDFTSGGPVVLYGDGSHKRKFMSVDDAAGVVEICLQTSQNGFQILHSPGVILSMIEIYEHLCKEQDSRPEIIFKEPRTVSQISTLVSQTSEVFRDSNLSSIFK
jgi:UDP-glucose 4-epimerase